jgi:hypothetical protein
MTVAYGHFANYGFVRDTVPADLLNELQAEIDLIDLENPLIDKLAGNLKTSYILEKSRTNLEKFVLELANSYSTGYDLSHTGKNLSGGDLSLRLFWVNFQRKHEFNPIHMHDGDFSFVIWLKVPFSITDELNMPHSKNSNMPRSGMFSFLYTNIFGEIREAEFPIDNAWEGQILLFPSCLQHMVYPFASSDDVRISISGNIKRK